MATNNSQNGWFSGLGIGFGSGSSGSPALSALPEQQSNQDMNQFEQLDRSTTGSNTLKRNPKMELTKTDLLKLVTYFEGEIQARDIVIAALKSERLKQVVSIGRYRPAVMADPYTALLRDNIADGPNAKSPYTERDMAAVVEKQLEAIEQLALQQRIFHDHMENILKETEIKHKKVIQELEEEKCKHEHDTAQGDDITYGLEMERTRLRQELEMEKGTRKKLEKELKRQLEIADEEKARQKQIVLLLLAERKKIIFKYIEEKKRSEDLGQILSEEKLRIDSMAEGLEEESKKSLQMEAELEKQVHDFEADKKSLKSALAAEEARYRELEAELKKCKGECEMLRKSVAEATTPMTSNVAKVVQPTATISSVPVCRPTTGIAQSINSSQALRGTNQQPGGSRPVPKQPVFHSSFTPVTSANATNVPQTPPKKGAVLGRGVPPPIPPNKPVIVTSKQTVPRRTEPSEADKKKVPATTAAPVAKKTEDVVQTPAGTPGIEILGQELADFQQMFVTMATSNNT